MKQDHSSDETQVDYPAAFAEVEALGKLTAAPCYRMADRHESTDSLKAIYYDGLGYQGRQTKVFAWLGMPTKVRGKVPAVVLVHGGGGTAYKGWVERWNRRGFAAISIAVEGQTDEKPRLKKRGEYWQRHQWSGPARRGIYDDFSEPVKEQWMYHAVAQTILAHSLLRSLPEVDSEKIGIMGISWGGVITATVIGLDARFAFAIPTYGSGGLAEAKNQYGRSLGSNELYKRVWDPMLRLGKVTIPTLWFSWPGDQHFPMESLAQCYQEVSGDYMVSLVPKLGHGHGAPWTRLNSYYFAEQIVETGVPWCQQVSGRLDGSIYEVIFQSSHALKDAVLVFTADGGFTGNRAWLEAPAEIQQVGDRFVIMATIPEGTTAWFVNVKSGKCTVSSDYAEVSQ